MSDFADEFYEDDDQHETQKNPVRARLKQLEKQNAELLKQIEQANEAQKKLTFMEAGINASDPKFKYFVKGYDGEFTAEAIRQAAEEAQLITPSPSPAAEDRQAWQQSNRVAAGAETSSEGPSWLKRINDAQSESELMAIFAEAQAQGIDLGGN